MESNSSIALIIRVEFKLNKLIFNFELRRDWIMLKKLSYYSWKRKRNSQGKTLSEKTVLMKFEVQPFTDYLRNDQTFKMFI